MLQSITTKESLLNKESTSDNYTNFTPKTFFLDSSTESLLTSAFNTNNFFSNLVANDYIDTDQNLMISKYFNSSNTLSSSPLSSGLSSLSSSLDSSITLGTSSLSNKSSSEVDSLLSRSSSISSLLETKVVDDLKANQPGYITSPIAPFCGPIENRYKPIHSPDSNQTQILNQKPEAKTDYDLIVIKKRSVSEKLPDPANIDWDLLNNSKIFLKTQNNQIQMDNLSSDFIWNLNRLIEMHLTASTVSNSLTKKIDLQKLNTTSKGLVNQSLSAKMTTSIVQTQKQYQTTQRIMNHHCAYNPQFIPQAQMITPYFLHQPILQQNPTSQKQYPVFNSFYSNNPQISYEKQSGRPVNQNQNRFYSSKF